VWARAAHGDLPDVERALYEDRTLVRLLGMRRTVFVVPVELVPAVLSACSRAVAARERRQLLGWLAEAAVADDVETWLAGAERAVLDAVTAHGSPTAAEVSATDDRLRTELVLARGKSYQGTVRVGSRVLLVLAAQGHVVRGRPLGSWTSTQFRWSPASSWHAQPPESPDQEAAEDELARRWLTAYGPATVDDLRWWTGWTVTATRRTLTRLKAVEVDLDGAPGVGLGGDLDPVEPEPDAPPSVALLPALDPTPMGWTRREFFLGPHAEQLFDRTGNVGPTIWVDGRVVGGWAQRADGEVAVALFEDLGAGTVDLVHRRAAALGAHLGAVRLSPRGRAAAPIERALVNGTR
jgi:hypothetical protein